jgi:hypothetical protein
MSGQSQVQAFIAPATAAVTATAAAGSAATATIPAAGTGLFNYITCIIIDECPSAALTGTAANIFTTTGITGTPSFDLAGALGAGAIDRMIVNFPQPLKGSATNTAATIVSPALANTVFRCTAFYYTDV